MSRIVSLVLVDDDGSPLGALPPFPVDVPYWPEVACVVSAARERFGAEVVVLRILTAQSPVPHRGAVTYLAQAGHAPPGCTAMDEIDLSDHPNRSDYARPGGPAASLRWAATALAGSGRGPVTEARQQRTWNLSAIWRLDTANGTAWLKQVPHFFAHEPTVLAHIAANGGGGLVPRLLAADAGRMLLDHVAGEDLHGADAATRDAIAVAMHQIHVAAAGDIATLIDAGVPDLRDSPLAAFVTGVVAGQDAVDPRLDALVAGLGERLAALRSCGLPDTLVHGDLHPGNVRGDDRRRVLIDWGDSFVGHPGFDILRLAEGLEPAEADGLIAAWARRWRAAVPGCDPCTAVELLRPVAALRNAAVYAHFLANIEPAEHPYHARDVGTWLAIAADLA